MKYFEPNHESQSPLNGDFLQICSNQLILMFLHKSHHTVPLNISFLETIGDKGLPPPLLLIPTEDLCVVPHYKYE
jgi:hypothetical protein